MPVQLTCEQCNDKYELCPSKAKNSSYCSRECQGRAKRKRVTLTCKECGEDYQAHKCDEDRSRFCSEDCRKSGVGKENTRTVTLTCENCASKFSTKPHKKDQKYCSHKCYWQDKGQQVTLACKSCGETYQRPPSKVADSRYCSDECRYDGHTKAVTLICKECGEEYTKRLHAADESNYCSRTCNHEAQRVGFNPSYPYAGENWQRVRRLVRDRDAYTCRRCGTPESDLNTELHVHHIIPLREFDEPEEANTPTNLVSVCPSCHGKVEGDVEAGKALL